MKKIAVHRALRIALGAAVFFIAAAGAARATDFSSTNFTVKDPVLPGGAGYATSTSFQLWSSIGQIAVGISTATNFGARGGFLYFPEPAAAPSPTPSPTPSPNTGLGSYLPQPPPSPAGPLPPPGQLPGIAGQIVAQIVGEPPGIVKCGRSDYNCDGRVNLRDLSIFFSYSRRVTPRNLSLVFSDWTDRLLRFAGAPVAARPAGERLSPPPGTRGLAQVGAAFEPAPRSREAEGERGSLLRAIGQFLRALVIAILRLFGLRQ